MPNFLLRLNDELYSQLRQRAFETEQPMSKYVREAIKEKLYRDAGKKKKVSEQGARSRPPAAPRPAEPPSTHPGSKLYECPVMGCDYKSISPHAMCSRHGRTVK